MASLFGFGGPSAKIEIELDNAEGLQKTIEVESDETKEELVIYSGADTIKGTVKVILPSGKKLEHVGIKIELIGTIGTFDSSPVAPFTLLSGSFPFVCFWYSYLIHLLFLNSAADTFCILFSFSFPFFRCDLPPPLFFFFTPTLCHVQNYSMTRQTVLTSRS